MKFLINNFDGNKSTENSGTVEVVVGSSKVASQGGSDIEVASTPVEVENTGDTQTIHIHSVTNKSINNGVNHTTSPDCKYVNKCKSINTEDNKLTTRRLRRMKHLFTPNLETISETATGDADTDQGMGPHHTQTSGSSGGISASLGFPSWIDRLSCFDKRKLLTDRNFDDDPYRIWMSQQCMPSANPESNSNNLHDTGTHIVFHYLYSRDFPNLKKCLEVPQVLYEIDTMGNTPLLVAARMGFKKVIRYMIKKASAIDGGVESTLNIQNSLGNTALHFSR